ncbi:uncharacterized protein P8A3.02c [Amaranthus tricolor]|uniref:uncharacterized protein P8A3.02c n=1 Tax=Amaranthus tricolor TaxID=29722 RepID=UPI0025853359|nr:uncharacterized protein P8A3.02c [Amaranthus tricolor]
MDAYVQTKLLEDVFGDSSDESSDDKLSDSPPLTNPNYLLISMDANVQRKLLEDVFGESSDDKLSDSPPLTNLNSLYWDPISEINGLWMCRDFLSLQQQSSLLSSIQAEGWFIEASHNQAMRFGDLPFWALELSNQIHEVVCLGDEETKNHDNDTCLMPPQLLHRAPFFDQLIVNVYQPGEGICAHVDLMRYEDGIAIVSLESSCVMHFSPVEKDGEVPSATKIPVHLTPGSLVIMSGEARYHWKHEINRKPGFQVWQGQELEQKRRTSITLRRLCSS